MAHAYSRRKRENPQTARTWDEAIKKLKEGDHYLFIPWDIGTRVERPPGDTRKLLGTALSFLFLELP
jgi:hypothetical protein